MKKILHTITLLIVASTPAFCQLQKGTWVFIGDIHYSSPTVTTTNTYPTTTTDELGNVSDVKGTQYNYGHSTAWVAFPSAGYFIADKLCAGIRAGFVYGYGESTSVYVDPNGTTAEHSDDKAVGFAGGPFIRYYFLRRTGKINIVAEIGYQYDYSITHVTFDDFTVFAPDRVVFKGSSQDLTAKGGLVFFITPRTALELLAGMDYDWDNGGGWGITGIVTGGIQLTLGK